VGFTGWYGWHEVTAMALNGVRYPLSIQWLMKQTMAKTAKIAKTIPAPQRCL
jgi:hypothetical protein